MHAEAIAGALDHHGPWPTAHRAVLDEHAGRVGIDIEVDPLTTVRTTHANRVFHDETRFV